MPRILCSPRQAIQYQLMIVQLPTLQRTAVRFDQTPTIGRHTSRLSLAICRLTCNKLRLEIGTQYAQPSLASKTLYWMISACGVDQQPYGREGMKVLLEQDSSGTEVHAGCRIQVPFQLSCIIGASTNIVYA